MLGRTILELSSAGPKLAELGTYLTGSHLAPGDSARAEQIRSFTSQIQILTEQVERMLSEFDSGGHEMQEQDLASMPPAPTLPQTPKRSQVARQCKVLPPSPEKNQKRKDSYSYH